MLPKVGGVCHQLGCREWAGFHEGAKQETINGIGVYDIVVV
jgi:hypothetical protein